MIETIERRNEKSIAERKKAYKEFTERAVAGFNAGGRTFQLSFGEILGFTRVLGTELSARHEELLSQNATRGIDVNAYRGRFLGLIGFETEVVELADRAVLIAERSARFRQEPYGKTN